MGFVLGFWFPSLGMYGDGVHSLGLELGIVSLEFLAILGVIRFAPTQDRKKG